MIIVSGAQMRQLDQEIIRRGVRPEALMEVVGLAVAQAVIRVHKESLCKATCAAPACHIVVGKGHNGADGLVAGRYLLAAGWRVIAWVSEEPERLSDLCAQQLQAYRAMGGCLADANDHLADASVIVDALLGTGARLPVADPLRPWLRAVKQAARPVVAIDLPSGVHADDGTVDEDAIAATRTVTCGVAKQGLYQYPGHVYAGLIEVASLGVTSTLLREFACQTELLDADVAALWWRPRTADSHKGTFGRACVCAGSAGMYGAARLALTAVARAGAGLVEYLAPPMVIDHIAACLSPEIVTRSVVEHRCAGLDAEAVAAYATQLRAGAVGLVGPGIGEEWVKLAQTHPAAFAPLAAVPGPMVYDATALTAIASLSEGATAFWQAREGATVITPHPKEFARLTGLSVSYLQSHRLEVAKQYARTHQVIVVLKGAGTIVAAPDGRAAINTSGNSGLATAGTGDVLAGLVTGMIASGYDAFTGACLAVYLHGRAADIACRGRQSEESLIATDILAYVGEVWHELRANHSTNSPGN